LGNLARKHFRRIQVVEVGKLIGIISLGDFRRAIFQKSFSGS
jgi:CBS domain-containing protein